MDIITETEPFAAFLTGPLIELKFLDGAPPDSGVVEGYGATFGATDAMGDTIMPGAFADTLARHSGAGTAPAMLWHHRGSEPVGKWTAMGQDAHGLRVRGQLNLDTARGRDAHAHLRAGDVAGLSIGYQVPPGGQARGSNGAARILKKIDLHEVSLTPLPADAGARVLSVKSVFTSRAELEEILNHSIPRGAVKKLLERGWAGLAPNEDDDESVQAIAAAIRASASRLKGS